MKRKLTYDVVIFITPLIVLLSYFLVKSWSAPYSDYAAYYFGSKELLHGNYQDVYETYRLNLLIRNQGYNGVFVSYTPFTPFTSLVLSSFLGFDIGVSKLLFNLFSSIAFIVSLYRLNRHLNGTAGFLAIAAIVFLLPIRNNILFGQAYLLLFSLLAEGFMAYQKKRLYACAIFWGTAIVFKVFPLVLFFYLLLKKDSRAAGLLLGSSIILLLISIGVNGYQCWLHYLHLLPRLNNGELNDSFTYAFQSFFMLAKETFVYDKLLNASPLIDSLPLFIVAIILFKTIVLGATVSATLKKSSDSSLVFGAWILCSLLISPNGSTYSLVLLAIPLVAAWNTPMDSWKKIILLLLMFATNHVSIHQFAAFPVLLRFPRLYLLLIFFAAIMLLLEARLNYKVLVIVAIICILPEFMRRTEPKDNSDYFLQKEQHILVTGTYVENGKLGYHYWSENGEEGVLTPAPVLQYELLSIVDNQVIYNGRRITGTSDNKRLPALVNKEYIIYLSDKNRGIGFYTLRKIQLNK